LTTLYLATEMSSGQSDIKLFCQLYMVAQKQLIHHSESERCQIFHVVV